MLGVSNGFPVSYLNTETYLHYSISPTDGPSARGGSDGTAPHQKGGDHLHARVSSACTSLAEAGRIFTIFSRERVGFLRFEWLQIGQDAL